MHPDEVLSFVREHEDPVVTAGEVAERFNVTSRAARYRLAQLDERGQVRGKKVGGSAKVWYATG
jgi:repressor of nif and glnA expression